MVQIRLIELLSELDEVLEVDFLRETAVAEWQLRLRGLCGRGGAAASQYSFVSVEDLAVLQVLVEGTETSHVAGLFLGDSHRGNDPSALHFNYFK